MKTLAVQLVTYNAEKYLPFLLDSLFVNQGVPFDLFVWDNASQDKTCDILSAYMQMYPTSVRCTFSEKNTGFSGGHNALYTQTKDAGYMYVSLLNQDMCLTPNCLFSLVSAATENADMGACTPRIMRWDFEKVSANDITGALTNSIDTLGLRVLRNRRVVEVGGGKVWNEHTAYVGMQKDGRVQEVFGVSGALPLYSFAALCAVELPGGFLFDPSFFMYKEDVDLAWRLRRKGYRALCVPHAVAYHDRTASVPADLRDSSAADQKKRQSSVVRVWSYLNHLQVLFFHTSLYGLLLDFFPIVWYEGKKALWLLLHDRKTFFHAWKGIFGNMRELIAGRRARAYAQSDTALRIWWQK
jgi:GT2 family glycosyltransferase